MPKLSEYQLKRVKVLKNKAFSLFKQGFPYREIGKIVGKSHTWVMTAIKGRNQNKQ